MTERDIYVGVGTPQANPTVEIEFRKMLRAPVQAITTRLTSLATEPAQRLINYIEQLPAALQSFDTMPLRAFGFACTGSSYLVGNEREDKLIEAAEQVSGIQVVTATRAIHREMQGRGAARIAILSPYPADLQAAAVAYWQGLGHNIVATASIDIGSDTRAIYEISDGEVAAAIASFDTRDADLLLLSGTGMPTLASLQLAPIPTISSNLCLATELLRRVSLWPADVAADIAKLIA